MPKEPEEKHVGKDTYPASSLRDKNKKVRENTAIKD